MGQLEMYLKELENHAAMVSLYFMYYNFARVHQTHVGSIEEIVGLLG